MMILGMEVPFLSSDSVDWITCSLPTPDHSNNNTSQPPTAAAAAAASTSPTQDYSSYSLIHTPPSSTYLFWRILKSNPRAIEILEVPAHGHVPLVGLRILFPNSLFPFAYICKNKASSEYDSAYLLYALQTDATAYVFQLKKISSYTCSHVFQPKDEFLQFDTNISPDSPLVTTAVAATNCLVLGRGDGTLTYFHFGNLLDEDSVHVHELRKEKRSRWRSLISSDSPYKPVKELVIKHISGRNVLLALHSNGRLRIWDLSTCVKQLSISLTRAGAIVSHLCVEVGIGADNCAYVIGLVYLLTFSWGEREITTGGLPLAKGGKSFQSLLVDHTTGMPSFAVSKDKLIDIKLSKSKIWILQEDGMWEFDLSSVSRWLPHRNSLQEAFISKQLFQDSESSLDALYQTTCSMFSSKEKMVGFFSSIFLRRLLQPGVCNTTALRFTLKQYNKHWTERKFQALSIHKLRKEILTLIEHEAVKGSPLSTFHWWKNFCLQYINQWRRTSAPLALFIDPYSGAVGLIRKNNVSLFRCLGDSELLFHGTNFDEIIRQQCYYFKAASVGIEHEILLRVHDCIGFLSQQFCPAIKSEIFYELVGGALKRSREDGVLYMNKALKCVSNTSISCISKVLGADFVWQKGLKDHGIGLGEFSLSLLRSVKDWRQKANGWDMILDVLKRYLSFLVPQKLKHNMENADSDVGIGNMKIPIMVQATSQVAGLMLESAFGIFFLLTYLLEISSQVNMLPDDISKIQLDLIPMINDIIVEWLIIHLFTTMPSDSVSDQELSKLKIDENNKQRSWTKKLGSLDFTLAFVLAMDAREGCHYLSLSSLPSPHDFNNSVRQFISWMRRQSEEKPFCGIENTTELTLSLLRNGQYGAVEILLMIVDAHSRCRELFANFAHGKCNSLHRLIECCLVAQPKVEYVDLSKVTDGSSTGKKQEVGLKRKIT